MSKWVPVTERLPKAYEHVLVSISGKRFGIEDFVTVDKFDGVDWFISDVVAWMPMPKPYERTEE